MWEVIGEGFNEVLAFVQGVDPRLIYLILFSAAFIENLFPPFPGDTFTIVAGYLAAVGKLGAIATLASVSIGTLLSVMLIYYVSYQHGRPYFARKRFKFFSTRDMARVRLWFARFGVWTLIFSRFIVGARVGIAIAAGVGRYPAGRMALFTFLSAVLFHGTLIGLAFFMHAYIQNLAKGFNIYSKIILVIVGILVILWLVVWIRRIRHGKEKT